MKTIIMSQQRFQHIFLIGTSSLKGVSDTLNLLINHLKELSVSVTFEERTATRYFITHRDTAEIDNLPKNIDLIIVVGGDGSMITAAHTALTNQIPILGINRGRLGFLTDISPNAMDDINNILHGQYLTETRSFLAATINNQKERPILALNDLVLTPTDTTHMIEFETRVNNELLYHQCADGMICATPTGSTAYALSGGGPIVQPGLDATVLVPMFPHTLSSRPIVIPANGNISLYIEPSNTKSPCLCNDGISRINVDPGSTIHIRKHSQTLQLIHPCNYNYFETLRTKLGWEKQASRR